MKIAYDISVMTGLVAACQSANEELQKAQGLIQGVHSHNDWTCREKDTIDDLMRECKKRIQDLCENQRGLLGAIRFVADDFTDSEKNISSLFGGVESLLGKILAIPVKTTTVVGSGLLGMLSGTGGNGGSTTNTGSSGVGHGGGGGGIDGAQTVLGDVKEKLQQAGNAVTDAMKKAGETHRQEIYAKYHVTFRADGHLVWPENEHPPMELLDAMGAQVTMSSDGGTTLVASWINEAGEKVSQKFVDPKKSLVYRYMKQETLGESIGKAKESLNIVSFQDMKLL